MWYTLAAILLLLAVIMLLPVVISADYQSSSVSSRASLFIKIGFIKINLYPTKEKKQKKPKKKKNTDKKPEKTKEKTPVSKRITDALDIYNTFSQDFFSILDHISKKAFGFESVRLHLVYSTGDAAATGILCGAINGAVYSLLGIIHNRTQLKRTDITIIPQFGDSSLDICAGCIVRLKNVHIIVIAVRLFKLILRIRKHSKAKTQETKGM